MLWRKTKMECLEAGSSALNLTADNHMVDGVNEFKYLGSILSSTGRCYTDISRQMGIAASIQRVWSRRLCNLYCVGADVKPCSINQRVWWQDKLSRSRTHSQLQVVTMSVCLNEALRPIHSIPVS